LLGQHPFTHTWDLAAQFGKRGDGVALLLQIDVVDLLFAEVDDLFRGVGGRRLAVALEGDRRRGPFARRLAAEGWPGRRSGLQQPGCAAR